jgi:Abnormal spindle-like microcephaly-assoc'd, ASPM-SPD-2-Hydin
MPLAASAACGCEGGGELNASGTPNPLAFGPVKEGTIVKKKVEFKNGNAKEAVVTGTSTFSGTDFDEVAGTNNCKPGTNVAAGKGCTLEVEFFPTAKQKFTGTWKVAYQNEKSEPGVVTVNITGEGT